ncbi:ABC transporter permease [Bacteroidia bacterium]|nr:ABC transporter permease [Bacteroidia bacterium]
MKQFIKNFLFVLKNFKTSSILNIVGLSVAFATCIIIMMQVDYDQNFDKCFENSDRIYRVELVYGGDKQAVLPRPFADILFESSPHIEAGALCGSFINTTYITIGEDEDKLGYMEDMLNITPSFVKVFKFNMVEGLETAMEEPGKVLIPQSMARKFFGKEPALGKTIWGGSATIGGVYKDFPANTSFGNVIYNAINNDENKTYWNNFNYQVFVRLDNPGAEKDIIEHFKEYLPEDIARDRFGNDVTIQFTNLQDLHFTTDVKYDNTPKTSRSSLAILWTIAFAILLIALINFVNFSLALVPRRIKSINTRRVLGAPLAVQRITLVSEAVFLNITAFFLSLILVGLASLTPVVNLTDAGIHLFAYPKLITGVFIVSLIAGIVSGLYPAIYSTSFQPALVLKGSFGLSAEGRKMRSVLVGVQFVASLVLIVSAGFIYLQNKYLYKVPVGYDKDRIIQVGVAGGLRNSLDVFKNEVKSFSGIEDISYSQFTLGASASYMSWGRMYRDRNISFAVFPVNPSFLEVMNIQITDGRNFKEEDSEEKLGKFIFNEKAKKEFNLELNSAVGDDGEIIGFIPDIHFATFYQTPTPMAFFVSGKDNWSRGYEKNNAYIKVKAGSDMFAAMKHVKKVLSVIDSDYPFTVRFYDDMMEKVYQKEQKLGFLITLFSIIAIVISMIGVFGLVVFETQYRRREISIRKVFGSSTEEVIYLFAKKYLITLGICFVIAGPIAYTIMNQWLEKFAYKIPLYWWVFLLGGLIVLAITLVTVVTQSYKAAMANPVEGLKHLK